MAIKGHSTFLKTPEVEPYHLVVLCHIQNIFWRDVLPFSSVFRSLSYPVYLSLYIYKYVYI